MLVPPKARCLDRPALVSLERLVPPDHFYRHREAALDLDFVRAWVAGCSAAWRSLTRDMDAHRQFQAAAPTLQWSP